MPAPPPQGPDRLLLAVPNISEGRDQHAIAAMAQAITTVPGPPGSVRLLDLHSDADHHRAVLSFAAAPDQLQDAIVALAGEAIARIDLSRRRPGEPRSDGQHPHVGALDVAPVVYLRESDRGLACALALTIADRIGSELDLPVLLYGELTAPDPSHPGRTRAQLRRGGLPALTERMTDPGNAHPMRADFGPQHPHPTAGVTLVAARPPLVAFNLQLAPPADLATARRIAGAIREGGAEGLPGLRAIAVQLDDGTAQVSMNVERPFELSLGEVVAAVRAHAVVRSGELVGLAPRLAIESLPDDLELPAFVPARQLIENALGC